MGKSARIIGGEFGLNAPDMNRLLAMHGYLDGKPGAWGLTEKGKPFAEEQYHTNGVGGYSHYQVNYETRTWNDDLAPALRADMGANPGGVLVEPRLEELPEAEEDDNDYETSDENGSYDLGAKEAAIIGGVLVGGFLLVRFGLPLWRNHIKPAAKKLREKFKKPEELMEAEGA